MIDRLCVRCKKNPGTVFRVTGGDKFTWTSTELICRECLNALNAKQDEWRRNERERIKNMSYRERLGYTDKPARRAKRG